MEKRIVFIVIVSFLSLCLADESFGQGGKGFTWRGSGGWGMDTAYQRKYDPATVEFMKGTVEAVEKAAPMQGMGEGVILVLKTDKETIPVHLGPAWYIERLDLGIKKGDPIEVRGSRVNLNGRQVIIAQGLKKEPNQSVVLRSDTGVPVWVGWR